MVGSYAYLDGELHVRLSLAMDAIVKGLTESRSHVMVSLTRRITAVSSHSYLYFACSSDRVGLVLSLSVCVCLCLALFPNTGFEEWMSSS